MPLDSTTWKVTETPAAEPDVFSLEGLIAWLKKQPAEGTYRFLDVRNCLICQYFRASGLRVYQVSPTHYWPERDVHEIEYPFELNEVARGKRLYSTYGAALEHARKLLAERNG